MQRFILRQISNSPGNPDLWEKKQLVRQLEGVSVFKKGNDYFYTIDPAEADIDEVRTIIKDVVSEKDYEKWFIQKCSLPHFLGEIEHKLNFNDFLPEYEISADIANITELSAYKTVFEVTMTESGQNRLRCMISTAMAKEHHLREDIRVTMRGFLSLYAPMAQLEFIVQGIHVHDGEDTAYQEYLYHTEYDLESYDISEGKRKPFPIKKTIGNWGKLALISNDIKVCDDFESTLSKDAGLQLVPYIVRFEPDVLCDRIRRIGEDHEADAIAIIRGPAKDRYSFWSLNDRFVCEAINESTIPVLLGVGHKTDKPICSRYTDYNAPTAGTLAARLAYWYAAAKIEQHKATPTQSQLNLSDTIQKEQEEKSFMGLFHKLFHW